jgi:DNA-binding MarR family transcriptional regulator
MEDRRVTSCVITDKARELLDLLATPIHELHERMFGELSPDERVQLVRMLDRVRAATKR